MVLDVKSSFSLCLVCVITEPTDIAFVIDEKVGGPRTMSKVWRFIKNMLKHVDMTNGNVNIKFIYECVNIPDIQLGQYKTKADLLAALSRLSHIPRTTADLLQTMTHRLHDNELNSVEPHHKIGVYITDGVSGNLSATLTEAQTAKLLHNIELYGVGILREDMDPTELRALVSCEVDEHLHMVTSASELDQVIDPLVSELCKGKSF